MKASTTISRTLLSLALSLCVVLRPGLALADTLPAAEGLRLFVVPDANQNFAGYDEQNAFGVQSRQITTNVGGSAYVSANEVFNVSNGRNYSYVSSTVITGGLFTKSPQVVSDSIVSYYINIAGPVGSQVPLNVSASGSVYTSHPIYLVDSRLQICNGICYNSSSGFPPTVTVISADACVSYGFVLPSSYQNCGNGRSASFSLSRQYLFTTNTLYNVTIDSTADIIPDTNILGSSALSSGTRLDPSFSLDSVYAATGLYTLETSESASPLIEVTPEPYTASLMILGVLFTLLVLKKQSWTKHSQT